MDLFIVVIALAFIQVWGANNPLHQDLWFYRWMTFLSDKNLSLHVHAGITLLAPIGLVIGVFALLSHLSIWFSLPLTIVVLLYSLGRGEFAEIVREYTQACYVEDWDSALKRAGALGIDLDDLNDGQWSVLHRRVLDEAGYRGFERMFAVVFWFFLLGPVAAISYRLLFLYVGRQAHHSDVTKILWLVEWPAIRLLGLSFALTGNFVGCFHQWRTCFLCTRRTSRVLLSELILGALTISDDLNQTCEVTRKELNLLSKLYTRTLWLWLGVAAFILLMN